ncbi:hypothetical protein GWO43_16010 [candidate division KSB1 bacterium]|nr:hypothetical protein [candidate division KSB1 bacterium]NIV68737.1 hypothetical protein [Phycisphaerae bacterium]NIS25456.1 hypothetical protein [candidate division KSB1 bacterium]NIT72348.1 hypothetical protein [candidate division KSB1 bacterium]NIU26133.1 hypothetical protein [candidate division KSB1 bacterium]
MAISDVSDLRQEIADHLESYNLEGKIDTFIQLAEERHKNEVRIQEMLNRDALTVNDRYVSLPSGYLEALELRLLTDPVTVLEYLSPHVITNYRRTGTGKPLYFTTHAQFEFDIDTDQSYSGEVIYYKAETALSDTNSSNNILSRAPGLYLYGALVAGAPYIMNDERLPVWTQLYAAARDGVNQAAQRQLRAGPIISRFGSVVA